MNRAKNVWEFVRGIAFLLLLTILLVTIFGVLRPQSLIGAKPIAPTPIPGYPIFWETATEPNLAKSTSSPVDSAYPPPAVTNAVPSQVIPNTQTPAGPHGTITPIPITPFPTLTLAPGPSPTLIPISVPAKDNSGTILFVAKESKDAKAALHSLGVDAEGKVLAQSKKVSDEEAPSDGFIFPSPDGSRLAITGPWGALSIFDTSKNAFEKMAMTLGPSNLFFNWYPDNRQILSGGGGSSLNLSDPVSGARTTLAVPGYGGISGAAASPDGQLVVYGYTSDAIYTPGLWVVNANGQNPHLLAKGAAPTNISWSPDGKRIAFLGNGWQVIDADGENLRDLAPGIGIPQCYFLPPLWSPDSKKLAIVTSESGEAFCQGWTDDVFKGTNIVLIDVDSGKPQPLLSDGSTGNIDPSWSPDGSQIAFVSNRGGTPEIWAVTVEGSNLRQLTANDHQVRFPWWSKPKQ